MTNRFKPSDFLEQPQTATSKAGDGARKRLSPAKQSIIDVAGKCMSVVEEMIDRDGVLIPHLMGCKAASDSVGFEVLVLPNGENPEDCTKAMLTGIKMLFDAGKSHIAVVSIGMFSKLQLDNDDNAVEAIQQRIEELSETIKNKTVQELMEAGNQMLVVVFVLDHHEVISWQASLRHVNQADEPLKLAINGAWEHTCGTSPGFEGLLQVIRQSQMDRQTKSKPSLN